MVFLVFSLFSVIQFPNDPCKSTSTGGYVSNLCFTSQICIEKRFQGILPAKRYLLHYKRVLRQKRAYFWKLCLWVS